MKNTISIIASINKDFIKINKVPCIELSLEERKRMKKYLDFIDPCVHRTVYVESLDHIVFNKLWTVSDKNTGLAIVKGVRGSKKFSVNKAIELVQNLCLNGNKPTKADLKQVQIEVIKEFTYDHSKMAA